MVEITKILRVNRLDCLVSGGFLSLIWLLVVNSPRRVHTICTCVEA